MKKILVSLFIGIVFLLPQVAFGKSAVLSGRSTLQAVRAGTCGGAAPIYSFAVSVEYTVNAYDNITNALLPENTTVPNGTQIRYVFEPLVSSNISWFMTGYSTDSPNGLWVNDMSTIPSI